MLGFAVDMASYAGVVTPDMARKIVAMGYTKFIINLWNDGILYDYRGRKPWEWDYDPAWGAKTTTNWQVDSAREAGAEVDGYIYYYANEDAETRTLRLLGNLEGRPINFLWLDWEEGMNGLSVEDTIAYMHKAQDTCIGVVYTGHYTRRGWWVEHTNDYQGFAGQWIWDATNDRTPDMSYNPYGGFRHYMEQYAFNVQLLPEMVGPVDLNVFYLPDEPAPVPVEPPPPELPPVPVEEEPPVENTPVLNALAAIKRARGFAESMRIALDDAYSAVESVPKNSLAEVLKLLEPTGNITYTPRPLTTSHPLWATQTIVPPSKYVEARA